MQNVTRGVTPFWRFDANCHASSKPVMQHDTSMATPRHVLLQDALADDSTPCPEQLRAAGQL
jgi:hypothetical protein